MKRDEKLVAAIHRCVADASASGRIVKIKAEARRIYNSQHTAAVALDEIEELLLEYASHMQVAIVFEDR